MQTLIVYYSRTGYTKKVAEALSKEIGCDTEELVDTANRSGPIGWLNSGRQGSMRQLTKLQPIKKDPAQYDLVIIGTPVWSFNMSSPVRTYIKENSAGFKGVALFCTLGGKGQDSTLKEMGELSGKAPKSTLVVFTDEVKKDAFTDKVKKFAEELKA
ncbi:MAG TPA: flavodoxin [Methanocella sp.]|nr:flavodoxin [Methanocella sp.]